MRLYHSPFSSNARRAVMTALHLGVPAELKVVDLKNGEQRAPSFLAMNPNGRVPVLEDDGFVLTESHAIMRYLAETTPGQTLYPSGNGRGALRERADVDRWLFWSAAHFQPAVAMLNRERVLKPMLGWGPAEPVLERKGEDDFLLAARVLDAQLAGKEWITLGRLTLADIALATPLMAAVPARLPLAGFDNVLAWFRRVEALDAWKKTGL